MRSSPVTAVVRGAAAAALACTLASCHIGLGTAAKKPTPAPPRPASSAPSSAPSSVDLAALYPGQVGLRFASDGSASSQTVDCRADVNFDVVVSTDGRPVEWKAASSDNVNNFIGNPIGGIDVAPASGTLQGGETATVHVSGAPTGIIQTFWIGVTDVRGSGATLEVDCAP
jgi:hypothetical protein